MKKKSLSILLFVLGSFSLLFVSCRKSFVPQDFTVPTRFETEHFVIRPIVQADAEKDYEAVMESIDIIHQVLLNPHWPPADFTLEQNKRDFKIKEKRFQRRESFTYCVLDPKESEVLGSIYINKGIGGPDAAVFMWVRKCEYEKGSDEILEKEVRQWISTEWPFQWVVYPGRNQQ